MEVPESVENQRNPALSYHPMNSAPCGRRREDSVSIALFDATFGTSL